VPDFTTADALLLILRVAHKRLAGVLLRLRREAIADSLVGRWTIRYFEERLALAAKAIAEVSGEVLGPAGEFGVAGQAAEASYGVGLLIGTKSLTEQGVEDLPPPDFEDMHNPAMRLIAQEMTDGFDGMYQAILREERDDYRRIQGHFTQVAMATGQTGDELTGRLVNEFIGRTQGGRLILPGGTRNWRIEDYADMLSRTVSAKATREASLNRITECGHDLALVIGGRIELTCDTCLWADGRVFSISGETEKPEQMPDETWGGPLELIKVERSAERDRILSRYHKRRIKNSPPVAHPRCIHSFAAYVAEQTPEEQRERLRVALEAYATKAGLDIATGGQPA